MPQYNQNISERMMPESPSIGWPWRLFLFSLVFFAISVVSYAGLKLGYQTYLNSQIDQVDQQIDLLSKEVPQGQQNEYLSFYSQVSNLQRLLARHITASRVFPLLEANTNQQVFYNKMDLSVNENKLTLEGFARSYDFLTQQLEAFGRIPSVDRYLISDSSLTNNRVNFKVVLFLKPNFMLAQ